VGYELSHSLFFQPSVSPSVLPQTGPPRTRLIIHRTRIDRLQLGRRHLVRRLLRPLPSVPILPRQGKGRHAASPGTHGEEACHHGSSERSATKDPRGTDAYRGGTTKRRSTAEDVVVLDRQERAVLVGRVDGWERFGIASAKSYVQEHV
jgi:hypothetical protein